MSNKDNFRAFEYYCCVKHQQNFNEVTIHWLILPDYIIISCKFEESFENIRIKREKYEKKFGKNHHKNILREYGIDAVSISNVNNINNEIVYNALQMKLWNNDLTICADNLGTFLDVMLHNFSHESKGYIYYTCKIGKTFYNNCLKKNKIIPIKIDNPFL